MVGRFGIPLYDCLSCLYVRCVNPRLACWWLLWWNLKQNMAFDEPPTLDGKESELMALSIAPFAACSHAISAIVIQSAARNSYSLTVSSLSATIFPNPAQFLQRDMLYGNACTTNWTHRCTCSSHPCDPKKALRERYRV